MPAENLPWPESSEPYVRLVCATFSADSPEWPDQCHQWPNRTVPYDTKQPIDWPTQSTYLPLRVKII